MMMGYWTRSHMSAAQLAGRSNDTRSTDTKSSGFRAPNTWECEVPKAMIEQAAAYQAAREAAGLTLEHGYKRAYLGLNELGQPAFVPLRLPFVRYGTSADAACYYDAAGGESTGKSQVANEIHVAPHPLCQCGFRALMVPEHLGKCGRSWFPSGQSDQLGCVLEVDLSGRVIEGTVGFRAEHIEVLSVTFSPYCWLCSRPEIAIFSLVRTETMRCSLLVGCCDRHQTDLLGRRFTVAELRGALGTELRFSPN